MLYKIKVYTDSFLWNKITKSDIELIFLIENVVNSFFVIVCQLPKWHRAWDTTKFLGKLPFTTQSVLPGRAQCMYLQNQQIQALRQKNSYQAKIILNQQSVAEFKWWKENLVFQNGRPLKIRMSELITRNTCFQKRLGEVYQGVTTGGTWSFLEQKKHINILKLLTVKFVVLTFTQGKSVRTIHLKLHIILPYLFRIGGGGGVCVCVGGRGRVPTVWSFCKYLKNMALY